MSCICSVHVVTVYLERNNEGISPHCVLEVIVRHITLVTY